MEKYLLMLKYIQRSNLKTLFLIQIHFFIEYNLHLVLYKHNYLADFEEKNFAIVEIG